jgi:hypothetical protein
MADEATNIAERLAHIMEGTRAMVPPELPMLCCATPEAVMMAIYPVPCEHCRCPTQTTAGILLAPSYQASQFPGLPKGLVVSLLIPICESCSQRYQEDLSSLDFATMDHAMERFWDCGVFLASEEDRDNFPWFHELVEELRRLQAPEDEA